MVAFFKKGIPSLYEAFYAALQEWFFNVNGFFNVIYFQNFHKLFNYCFWKFKKKHFPYLRNTLLYY